LQVATEQIAVKTMWLMERFTCQAAGDEEALPPRFKSI